MQVHRDAAFSAFNTMSFGFSVGDFVLLTQLAWRTLQNARQACGDYDELAQEASSLLVVLQQLEKEVSKPRSILNSSDDDRRNELATLAGNCRRVLNVLLQILGKYNALSEQKRSVTKLWKKIRFGNGEMQDLSAIRLQLCAHTNAITLFLNLLSISSQGNVERCMNSHMGVMRNIRADVNWITATLQARASREGSTLTSYTNDDKAFWKELRRELIREGYSSTVLRQHKRAIKNYVLELGTIGALDELPLDGLQDGLEDHTSRNNTPSFPHMRSGSSTSVSSPMLECAHGAGASQCSQCRSLLDMENYRHEHSEAESSDEPELESAVTSEPTHMGSMAVV